MPLSDVPVSSGVVTYGAGLNDVVFSGSVSWTLNENAVKTLDIPIPKQHYGQQYLVSIKNGSATVTLDVEISNLVTFTSGNEAVPITTVTAIATNANKGVVVTGWPLGNGGRLKFTKSAATAAAFNAYVEIRRA